ncbi:hypothetical protein HPB50_012712 [Hyalomma asiaticum]|uniref:Uncharacterized protein n=1 Tax=Hyalomma asiaticum TaxID=266040 RepID=A0ACB7RTL0_HYAAI|nr:hypothetical protein HPB50_012712 [Hyalomma asiaticum]
MPRSRFPPRSWQEVRSLIACRHLRTVAESGNNARRFCHRRPPTSTVSPGFLQLGAIGMNTYEASRAFKALWMRRLLAQGRREVARKNASQEGNQPNQTLQSAPTLGREAMASKPSSGTVNATTVPALCPREDVYPALGTRSASSVRSGKQARRLLLLWRMRADFTANTGSNHHCHRRFLAARVSVQRGIRSPSSDRPCRLRADRSTITSRQALMSNRSNAMLALQGFKRTSEDAIPIKPSPRRSCHVGRLQATSSVL